MNLGVSVLTATAGLADVLAFRFGVLANGLAIRHLRLADVGLDFVLAHHAVDDDFQMQLAHAADDGLSAVGIGVNFEGGIFLGQPASAMPIFSWSALVLGSTATEITGTANVMDSSAIGCFSSQIVSPV